MHMISNTSGDSGNDLYRGFNFCKARSTAWNYSVKRTNVIEHLVATYWASTFSGTLDVSTGAEGCASANITIASAQEKAWQINEEAQFEARNHLQVHSKWHMPFSTHISPRSHLSAMWKDFSPTKCLPISAHNFIALTCLSCFCRQVKNKIL